MVRACWLALAALLLLILGLLLSSLDGMGYAARYDEGYYLRYMSRFAHQGFAALPALFREYVATPGDWIFPNPLRVLYIVTTGLCALLLGTSYATLTVVSLVSLPLLVVAVFAFFLRRAGPQQALWTAALTACSPLLLGLSRRALSDSFATLWMGLACCLAYEALGSSRGRGVRAAFVGSLLAAILSKEPAVLLCVPLLAFALYAHVRDRRPARALWGDVLLLGLPPVLAVLAWVAAAGGPALVGQVGRIILGSPAQNEYAIHFGGGPWSRYLLDEIAVSPVTMLLAIAGAGSVLSAVRRGAADPLAVYLLLLTTLYLGCLCLFTKNLRYAAPLEFPLRALAVLQLAQWLPPGDPPRRRWVAGTVAVAALCWLDWRSFDYLFVERRLYDPISYKLFSLLGLVPE